jgi:tetratricopeptide (TPR) repeat protein
MKSSVFTNRPRHLLMVLGVFLIFIAYHTYTGSFQLANLSGDQINIGVMVLKQSHPELFARDYMFRDTSLFQFYTPLFRWLVEQLMCVTRDYAIALLGLMPIIMFFYLTGMFVLVYSVTESILASILVALVSSLEWRGFPADAWGVTGLNTLMTPRALYAMLAPWLFLLMFRWLRDSQRWKLPLLAFLGGLGANLHPVSGMIFTQLLLSMIILTQGVNRRALTNLLLSALAALVGATPILLNFVRHSGGELGVVPFEVFYRVMHERIHTLFPFRSTFFFGYPLNARGQEVLLWMYTGGILIWGGLYLLCRRGRLPTLSPNVLYGILFGLQVPAAYFLTGFEATALVVVTIFYWAYRLLRSELDRLDRWLLYLMGLTVCYSFVASYVLEYIWKYFELWSLTSFLGEQPRAARFIYLPLFLYAARFMQAAARLGWRGYLLIVATACLMVRAGYQDLLWSIGLGLLVLGWPEKKILRQDHLWLEPVLGAATIGVTFKAVLSLAGAEDSGWLALYGALAYGVLALGMQYPAYRRRLLIGTSALVLAGAAFSGTGVYRFPILSPIRSLALTPSRLWMQITPDHLKQGFYERRDDFELYDWARTHTAPDSLFYHDSFEFRFWAQRSITHSYRDVGTTHYQGARMVEFYDRYKELERARQEVSLLLAQAEKHEVDFIVATSSQAQPVLPVAFSNSTYTVYRYDPAMAAINLHLAQGEWEEAIRGFKELTKLSPDNTWAYFGLGRAYQTHLELEQAEAAYLEAIDADWYNVPARLSLAQVYAAQGKMEEAIRQYAEAIRLRPDYLTLHEGLGDVYLAGGRLDEAVAEYEQAIGFPPETADYHSEFGSLLYSKGLNERAIQEYLLAIDLDPESSLAYYGLGTAYRVEGRLEEALYAYKQAAKIDPDHMVTILVGIGHVYKAQGKVTKAISQYRRAISINPRLANAYLALGNLYQEQGEIDEAIAVYQQAIAMQPECTTCYIKLGEAYKDKSENEQALTTCQQAIAIDPGSATSYASLGDLYRDLGKDEAAIEAYQRAVALHSDSPYAYIALGKLYKEQGRVEEAVVIYRQALTMQPGRPDLHALLGNLYEAQSNIKAAIGEYEIAVTLNPDNQSVRSRIEMLQGTSK